MCRSAAILALALASASPAWAHVPHDPAYWVAVSLGEDPSWVVTTLPVHVRNSLLLVRTQDQQDVELRYAVDSDEGINTAVLLEDDFMVLGTDGRGLWASSDLGDSFDVLPDIPADATIHRIVASPDVIDDGLVLAIGLEDTTGGPQAGVVWRSRDGGKSWVEVFRLPGLVPWDIKLSPSFTEDQRAFVVTRDGLVHRSSDAGASWDAVAELSGTVHEVAVGPDGRVWLATDAQGLWRSQDDGESFEAAGYDDKQVVTVAEFPGELVLFTYADEAVYRSTDGGETFERFTDDIEDASPGQPADGIHYYEFHQSGDGALWLASWEGLIKSTDNGETWQHVETYLPEAVRDIAVTFNEADNPAVMASAFGGGAYLADPITRSVVPMGFDLAEPFFKRVATSHDYGRDQAAFIYLLTWLMATNDSDESWQRIAEQEMGDFWDLSVSPNYRELSWILAAGGVADGGGWCISPNDGTSWSCHSPDEWANYCSATHVSDEFTSDGLAWVACGEVGEVIFTSDFGAKWRRMAVAGTPVWGLAGTPGGQKVFMATHSGLYVSTEGTAPQLLDFEGQSVWDVAVSPTWDDEPEAFALVPGDGWYRSSDAGETWEKLDAPTDDPMMTVALSPDFADDRTLAVGGFDGSWYSTDAGETWEYVHALELITDFDPLWDFDDSWTQESVTGAINETRQTSSEADATATLRFRGVGLDLYAGTQSDGGYMQVVLDGVTSATVDLSGDDEDRVVVYSERDLEDAWHTLEVTVLEGLGIVDSAVVWRLDYDDGGEQPEDTGDPDSEPPDSESPTNDTGDSSDSGDGSPTSRCAGCATSASGGGVLGLFALGFGLLGWRRRA